MEKGLEIETGKRYSILSSINSIQGRGKSGGEGRV